MISVDTKKKELIGEYKNKGQEWERKKEPVKVNMHNFPDPKQGKFIPYGIYGVTSNQGWLTVLPPFRTLNCHRRSFELVAVAKSHKS